MTALQGPLESGAPRARLHERQSFDRGLPGAHRAAAAR